MTNDEIESFLARVVAGTLTARSAIALLIGGGFDPEDAEQAVFSALGGSDQIATGDDDVDRYQPSGRPVREVEAAMDR